MASRKPALRGYVRDEEVEQIVRSAVRVTARAAARQPRPDSQVLSEPVRLAIKEAVNEAFTSIGLDVGDPTKTQKNMAYLNSLREFTHKSMVRVTMTALSLLVTAVIAAMLIGFGVPEKWMAYLGLTAAMRDGK